MKQFYALLIACLFSAALTAQTHIPIIEVFTSSTCGPCLPGNVNLDGILALNENKYSLIKYQMSWPGNGDPYYTTEGGSRRNFYGINSIPHMVIDGTDEMDPRNFTQEDLDFHLAKSQQIAIDLSDSVVGQTMHMDFDIEVLQPLTGSAYRLMVGILEDTTYLNDRTNGEDQFHMVMKKMLPNGTGELMLPPNGGYPAGHVLSFSKSFEFKGTYDPSATANNPVNHSTRHTVEDFSNLVVAVWMFDLASREVIGSTNTLLNNQGEVSSTEESNARVTDAKVYPNPAEDIFTLGLNTKQVGIAAVEIVNMLGEIVSQKNLFLSSGMQRFDFNSASFVPGLYLIKVTTGDNTHVLRLMKK